MSVDIWARSALLVLVVTGALVGGPSAWATLPGANGEVVYVAFSPRTFTARAIQPDGSGDRRLLPLGREVLDAAVTADGSGLLFFQDSRHGQRLKLRDLAGGDTSVVIPRDAMPGYPLSVAGSPDGLRAAVCVTTRTSTRLFIVAVDGSGLAKIPGSLDDCFADWSVDDVIVASQGFGQDRALVTMAPDGSGHQQVLGLPDVGPTTHFILPVIASWTPDAGAIVFSAQWDRARPDIWKVDPDGANLTNLTATPRRGELAPRVSPDGTAFAYARTRTIDVRGRWDLWVADIDGSGRTPLTDTLRRDEYPASWRAA